eukprot:5573081-Pleurochrysis_carterae.AAC.1
MIGALLDEADAAGMINSCEEPKYGGKKDSCEGRSPAGKFEFAKRMSAEFAEIWSCRKCRGTAP